MALYRAQWNAEHDLRSLKQTMQMKVLRCTTPQPVRNEIWTHILAYSLIRTIMAPLVCEVEVVHWPVQVLRWLLVLRTSSH